MKKTLFVIFSVAMIFSFFSCKKAKQENAKNSSEVSQDISDFGDDKTVIIGLDANQTTGFSWTCELSNPVIAEIISDTYEQDPAPEGMVGVGGTQSFVFDCKQTGLTDLTFTYRRPGEDGEIAEIRYAQLLVDENLQGEFRFFER